MSRIERLMEERIQYMIDQMLPPKPPAGGGWPYVPFFPRQVSAAVRVVVERM